MAQTEWTHHALTPRIHGTRRRTLLVSCREIPAAGVHSPPYLYLDQTHQLPYLNYFNEPVRLTTSPFDHIFLLQTGG
jgi:hypothetical protein